MIRNFSFLVFMSNFCFLFILLAEKLKIFTFLWKTRGFKDGKPPQKLEKNIVEWKCEKNSLIFMYLFERYALTNKLTNWRFIYWTSMLNAYGSKLHFLQKEPSKVKKIDLKIWSVTLLTNIQTNWDFYISNSVVKNHSAIIFMKNYRITILLKLSRTD